MSKRDYRSVVVRIEDIGDLKVLCFTDAGQPAIYCENGYAEQHAAQLRDRHPGYRFAVIDFLVL